MFQSKKVFKVISPMNRRDGNGTYWMRCGSAYVNKDNSINIYIEALPVAHKDQHLTLQLRELSDDELRERAEKRTTYSARGTLDANVVTATPSTFAADGVPF